MLLVACGGTGDTETTTAATTTAATTTAATTTAATTTAATTTAATTTAATTTAATTTAATTTAATTTAATTTAGTEAPTLADVTNKIYADIDFKADGTMVDTKDKLDLDKGTATIGETDVTFNGTTIKLPTLQANGLNVGKATFKDFADAATAVAFWNDADGFAFEAFYVCRGNDGSSSKVEGVFCATENPGTRSGLGIAAAEGNKPYFCLGVTGNAYVSLYSNVATSKTEYVHVVTTGIVTDGTLKAAIYVNGVLANETTKAATIHVTDINKTFLIGGDTNKDATKVDFTNDDFSVADIKVYGAALSAAEVKVAYKEAVKAFSSTPTLPAHAEALTDADKTFLTAQGVDASKYAVLKMTPVVKGYYNSTDGSKYSQVITTANNSSGFWVPQERYSKEQLPVGSIITIKDGYQYRPDGWQALDAKNTVTRPGNVSTAVVKVDDTWWTGFNYRCFNVSKKAGGTISDSDVSALRIYIPIA